MIYGKVKGSLFRVVIMTITKNVQRQDWDETKCRPMTAPTQRG